MRTEADRKAFYENQKAQAKQEAVAKWLKENPEVGVLNGGKYYKIENGEMVEVQEFAGGF